MFEGTFVVPLAHRYILIICIYLTIIFFEMFALFITTKIISTTVCR